jgi:hypothetical protein
MSGFYQDIFKTRPLTPGAAIFASSEGLLDQDVTNLFWDDGNNRLGIGTDSPDAPIEIRGNSRQILLSEDDTNNVKIGSQYSGRFIIEPYATTIEMINAGGVNFSLRSAHASQLIAFSHDLSNGTLQNNVGSFFFNNLSGTGYVFFKTNNITRVAISNTGLTGFGTTNPARKMEALDSTAPQLRLTHTDNTIYADAQINSSGELNVSVTAGNTHRIGGQTNLADDGTYDLPNATSGFGFVQIGDNQEWAQIAWKTDGTVTLVANSANVINSDTDGNLCIFDNGSQVRIKNRLGSVLNLKISIYYA